MLSETEAWCDRERFPTFFRNLPPRFNFVHPCRLHSRTISVTIKGNLRLHGLGNALTQFRNGNEKTMAGTLIYEKHPRSEGGGRGLEEAAETRPRFRQTLRCLSFSTFFFGTVSWKWPSSLSERPPAFQWPLACFATIRCVRRSQWECR